MCLFAFLACLFVLIERFDTMLQSVRPQVSCLSAWDHLPAQKTIYHPSYKEIKDPKGSGCYFYAELHTCVRMSELQVTE